jgi:hypothetical protein
MLMFDLKKYALSIYPESIVLNYIAMVILLTIYLFFILLKKVHEQTLQMSQLVDNVNRISTLSIFCPNFLFQMNFFIVL